MPTTTLPLHDPAQWPVVMRRQDVAAVLQVKPRTLYDWQAAGKFPAPDFNGRWRREVVVNAIARGRELAKGRARILAHRRTA